MAALSEKTVQRLANAMGHAGMARHVTDAVDASTSAVATLQADVTSARADVDELRDARRLLGGTTTDATPLVLTIAGTAAAPTIAADTTVGFTLYLVARKPADGTVGARFVRAGLIANNAGTTALVGSVATVGTDINASALAVAVTADNAADALAVTVTGLAATTLAWAARLELVEAP